MATDEVIIKIVQQVEGDDKIAKSKDGLDDLSASYDKARDAQGRFVAGSGGVKAAANDAADSLGKVSKSSDAASGGVEKVGGSSKNMGRAILEGSRALEDLQYGIAGVLNNLPSLTQALGYGPGIAGVISVVAVGAVQLYKHWDDLGGLWGESKTKSQADQMAELAKQTEKTAAETKKLADYERERASAKTVITGQSKEDSARATAVENAFKEAGGDKVMALLRDFGGKQVGNAAPQEMVDARADQQQVIDFLQAKRAADPENLLSSPDQSSLEKATKARDDLDAAMQKRVDDWIEKWLGKIPNDPKALAAFVDKVEASGKNPELVDDLRQAQKSPDQKAKEEAHEDLEWEATQESIAKMKAYQKKSRAEEKAKTEAHEDLEWEATQESIAKMKAYQKRTRDEEKKNLEREAKEGEKKWDDDLKAAKKSRSFVGKADNKLTPAEKEAKRLYDDQEKQVATAAKGQTWLGKEDEELSPAEKIAKGRAADAERKATAYRKDQVDAPGLKEFIRDALIGGAGGGELNGVLRNLGIDAEGRQDLLGGGQKAAYEKMLSESEDMQKSKSETLNGGAALRDAIQGGVNNDRDLLQLQADRLGAAVGYLQTLTTQRPYSSTAIAG